MLKAGESITHDYMLLTQVQIELASNKNNQVSL